MGQSSLFNFVDNLGNSEVSSLAKKFDLIEKAEKEGKDVRALEKVLFVPSDLKVYEKFDSGEDEEDANGIVMYFTNEKFLNLFKKYFKVNYYIEPNVHRIEPLILFLLLLEKGIIVKEESEGVVKFKITAKEAAFSLSEVAGEKE